MSTGRFEYGKLSKYPHMKPEDVAVWERFIELYPKRFDRCDYDFPVGKGAPADPSQPENLQKDFTLLTQKKVDVVAYTENAIYIIELKPVADARGFGQVLTYMDLFPPDLVGDKLLIGMLICSRVEREMDQLYAKHGIQIEVA